MRALHMSGCACARMCVQARARACVMLMMAVFGILLVLGIFLGHSFLLLTCVILSMVGGGGCSALISSSPGPHASSSWRDLQLLTGPAQLTSRQRHVHTLNGFEESWCARVDHLSDPVFSSRH